MMLQKKILGIILGVLFSISCSSALAVEGTSDTSGWGEWGNKPIDIIESIHKKANSDYAIQETALDGVHSTGRFGNYRIAGTLDYVRKKINVYLQWMMYIGLSLAVIILIRNGLMMVTNGIHNSGSLDKVKKNIKKVVIGVILMTGFYGIMKLILAGITMLVG